MWLHCRTIPFFVLRRPALSLILFHGSFLGGRGGAAPAWVAFQAVVSLVFYSWFVKNFVDIKGWRASCIKNCEAHVRRKELNK